MRAGFYHNEENLPTHYFGRSDHFVISSKRIVSAGDWDAVLHSDLDHVDTSRDSKIPFDVKDFREFIIRFDLVDKFRNEYPKRV